MGIIFIILGSICFPEFIIYCIKLYIAIFRLKSTLSVSKIYVQIQFVILLICVFSFSFSISFSQIYPKFVISLIFSKNFLLVLLIIYIVFHFHFIHILIPCVFSNAGFFFPSFLNCMPSSLNFYLYILNMQFGAIIFRLTTAWAASRRLFSILQSFSLISLSVILKLL